MPRLKDLIGSTIWFVVQEDNGIKHIFKVYEGTLMNINQQSGMAEISQVGGGKHEN